MTTAPYWKQGLLAQPSRKTRVSPAQTPPMMQGALVPQEIATLVDRGVEVMKAASGLEEDRRGRRVTEKF